jgi:glutathione S-transferase
MAKHFRPLLYQRLLGPVVRATRTLDEALALARRSTDDPTDLEWERRVWSLAVLNEDEERREADALLAFLDHLERALFGREFLVGDAFTQAEISVYPRVRMFPFVGVPISAARHPNVARWRARLERRACFPATVSKKEAAIARFASSPVLAATRRILVTPMERRTLADRAALGAVGRVLRFAMRERRRGDAEGGASWSPATASAPPSAPRPLARIAGCEVVLSAPASSVEGDALRIALSARGIDHRVTHGEAVRLSLGARTTGDATSAAELVDALPSPASRLFPDDAWGAAETRMWLAFDASMHKEVAALKSPLGTAGAHATLGRRLDQLDAHLRGRGFVAAGTLTFADIWLASRCAWLSSVGARVHDGRPNLLRWYRDIVGRPFVSRVLGRGAALRDSRDFG